jgi:hypothetical protein
MADSDPLDDFVALSAILTGVKADKLHPQLDVYETAAEYLAYATENGGAVFGQLMGIYTQNSSQPATIPALIFAEQQSPVAYMAKAVTLMWYLGSWYDPAGLKSYYDTVTQGKQAFAPSVVISSNAYTQGWAWKIGQAHPMGYSDWRFGYWNTPPQPLSDFIGGN